MTQLSVSLLGPFQVSRDEEVVTQFGSDTARALLAYLAMQPGVTYRRDALAGLLWPEQPNTEALRNLRVALSRLRDAIGDRQADIPYLEITRQTIQLNGDTRCSLDTQLMREALAITKTHEHTQIDACEVCAQQLQAVAALYRGEFLAGFTLDSVPFEEWMVVERENLHWQALEALYALTRYHEQQGNYEGAIDCARRQIELEVWRESAHRQLMRALALSGRRSAALAQYDTCRKILSQELGVEPEIETVKLYENIRNGNLAPSREILTEQTVTGTQAETESALASVSEAEDPPGQGPQSILLPIPEGERRTVTVVQAEVHGTDEVLALDDAEGWAAMMSQLLRTAGAEVHRYGGEVNRYDENGLVALFGAQTAHENDPERGVLTALAMQKAFQAQLAQLENDAKGAYSIPTTLNLAKMDLRIAVHTGKAIVTLIEGDGGTGRRAVMGDAVISTSRLLAEVVQDEVRVSEATYKLVAPLFEWEPRDDGNGYVPLDHQLGADKGRGIPGMQSELVGREREFQILHEVVEQLQSGIGGIVTLVGEAGIGKSRLVAEVRKSANVTWVEGRCLSYSGTIAYSLWRGLLHALLGTMLDIPPAIFNHVLRKHLGTLSTESYKLAYAYLGSLLTIPLDAESEALITQLDAENLKNGIYTTVENLFQNTAQRGPLAIVCEDLHWADPTSLALLERLLSLTDHVPVLFICVLRPQREHGCWQIREKARRLYPHRHIDIQLDPLTSTDSAKLLENLLLSLPGPDGRKPVVGLPETFKAQILSRGEGNPFFVEEILRSLIHSGDIVCDTVTCQWQTGRAMEDIGIPETLYGVLRSRIDQLPLGALHILQLASVIGRIFSYPLLADIAERQKVDEHLVILQRAQMIRERARLPVAEYIFNHQLTLEAVYGGLLHRVQRVLHRRVAEALERLYPDRIEAQLGILAQHWEQAGDNARALVYLQRAGMQAAAQYANGEALGYLARALNLMPRDDLTGRYAVLSMRVVVYDRQGAREVQRKDVSRLQDIADALNDGELEATRRLTEVALHEANLYEHTFNHSALADAGQKAVRLARAIGDVGLEAEGHLQWGTALHRSWDNAQGHMHWEKALALARESGHRHQEARVLRELGITIYDVSQFSIAKVYLEQNLQIHRETGNMMEEGKALNALGLIAMRLHDLAGAKVYVEDGLRLCRLTGNRREEAWAVYTLGAILSRLGRHTAGDEHLQKALRLFRQVGDPFGEGLALTFQGWIARIVGEDDVSRNHSEQALHLADATQAGMTRAIALIVLGDAMAGMECWSDATEAFDEALTLCHSFKWHHWAVSAQAGLARVAFSSGQLGEAQIHLRKVLSHVEAYPKLNGTHDPMHVYLTCYRVLRAADDPRAAEVLQNAYHLLQTWANNIDDEELRFSFLENVPEHRKIVIEYEQEHE